MGRGTNIMEEITNFKEFSDFAELYVITMPGYKTHINKLRRYEKHYKKDFLYISSMSLMNLMKLFFLIHLLSVLGR